MRKNLIGAFLLCLFVASVFSCKKKKNDDINPFGNDGSVCPLKGMVGENGESVRDYEYVKDNLIRIYNQGEPKTTISFKYNEKNEITTMEVQGENDLENLSVKYLYDENQRVNQTTTSVAGIPFMTNTFVLSNGKISSVITKVSVFGKEITGNTRLVYKGKNVSEVYSSIDGDPEKMAFKGAKYDDKQQFQPAAYKIAALGFVGIANNFFSFFGENNMISGTVYDENGKVDQKTDIIYTYTKAGLPLTSETATEKNGDVKIQKISYEFQCK